MNDAKKDHLEIIQNASWFKRHAHQTFFDAMNQGYVAGTQKGGIETLPGSRTIEFKDGDWRVLDLYFVSEAGKGSGGTTTMWYGDIPIWMMQYIGFYQAEAGVCLKAALSETYKEHRFEGGRGPRFFSHAGLHYVNNVQENNFFGHACGQEFIYIADGVFLGQHRYQSQWLVEGLW